ncbi:MAG: type II CAAX prenyl endopeptidase Rce1 family protein [Promethearchaeota archaeon]
MAEEGYRKAETVANDLETNEIKQFELRNIVLFLLITFAWTWLLWLASVISPTGHSNFLFSVLFIIGGYGPSVSAFLLTYITEKKEGVKILWKRFWNVKIKIKWLLITFLLFPALFVASSLLVLFVQGLPSTLAWISQPWVIITYILTAFFAGGFSEEFGWRGYALDRFQAKLGALISSLILGVIWGLWHLPTWFIAGDPHGIGGIPDFFLFVIETAFLSILYTWVYNNTNRSIFVAVMFHTIYNFMTFLIILPDNGDLIYLILFYITVIIVVLFFIVKKISKIIKQKLFFDKNVRRSI